MKATTPYYPTDIAPAEEWLMCNALIGAQPYNKLHTPISFNEDLEPAWYKALSDEKALEYVWQEQERYVQKTIEWIAKKGIVKSFFDGAYEKDEAWFNDKYSLGSAGSFSWSDEMSKDLPKVNIYNVYLEAKDGTVLIAYESWDTLFIKDTHSDFPNELRSATLMADDLPDA